ncbi:YbhB/YbcL family Raf kinase inhibitor-like protein [Chryseosolibacter indicus]|uniref:YbhB/YbcL family Raf kinase inhibitor-like protein n=1 Tax=Chryseosolibacter indicus TaxID=2782351 RepID=A0ABS5VWG5_9BACT|nr:YbhB/YbcL family Raf kinase inhibitor-like protein [Chryseosolibacter indicus]MBT1705172.1 YbhB/YbcL family Raf kinase inhibitor-like protein [Chryseosolibacter indicus]
MEKGKTSGAVAAVSTEAAATFTLRSKDLGGQFTKKHFATDCAGENISPELHWENAPKETKAFALTMYDMDAPTGSGLWHWVVYNIPATLTFLSTDSGSLLKNQLPNEAVGGLNDAGVKGYYGPCPPPGQLHRYIFTVHALSETIQATENASAALTGFLLNMNTIAKASLVVYAQQ